jgi:putative transposase
MAVGHDKQEQVRAERARAVGLFRYSLIREAADPKLSTKQRGRLVRDLAAREHVGPFGQPVRVARATIDRWIRDWRRGGFDALVPNPRRVSPRTPADVLDLAVALKKEVPARTAVQVAAILRAHCGWAPDERTLQRHFVRRELNTRPDGMPPKAFGRFEADAPNQRWTGDALHGPTVNGRKAILFAFIDDHSRLLPGYRWARREDTVDSRRRCAPAWPRVASRPRSTWTTGRRCRPAAAARLRIAGDQIDPLQARAARRSRQDRTLLQVRARAVPRRDRLRPRTG